MLMKVMMRRRNADCKLIRGRSMGWKDCVADERMAKIKMRHKKNTHAVFILHEHKISPYSNDSTNIVTKKIYI